ncbi:uncharacterized protein KY384_005389 [Bacidia gigantensis]|uniref:uncharacterized protein n=1 Tax=Bacidia gigantensis TaxID=2732470 RepID=UPI001D03B34C|nr:uncharacterized protein KY384_005389 [Bacidia gigantensis]KAG8529908.1 hypothetical protein KY384_005389 [Bacidia gigantensis]
MDVSLPEEAGASTVPLAASSPVDHSIKHDSPLSEDDDPSFQDLLRGREESSSTAIDAVDGLMYSIQSVLDKFGRDECDDSLNFLLRSLQPMDGTRADLASYELKIRTVLSSCSNLIQKDVGHGLGKENVLSTQLTRLLATLSRERLWAAALTESGVLDAFLNTMDQENSHEEAWIDPALRLVANCCARSAQTRLRILSKAPFKILVARLQDPNQADIALLALYSIHLMTYFLNTYDLEISSASSLQPQDMNCLRYPEDEENMLAECRVEIVKVFGALGLVCQDFSCVEEDVVGIVRWLGFPADQIRICSCIFLGNLVYSCEIARSDLLHNKGFASALSQCIRTSSRPDVLNSALDLLQNIAIDLESRKMLGQAGIFDALAACWDRTGKDMKSKIAALYHTRQLICGCLENVCIVLKSQALPGETRHQDTMFISKLLHFHSTAEDRSSITEVGRIIVEIWRTCNKHQDLLTYMNQPLESLQAKEHPINPQDGRNLPLNVAFLIRKTTSLPGILDPLFTLVRSENESLVTEGWLALALMASSPEGATIVYNGLFMVDDEISMLRAVLDKQDGPQNGARSNALYLAAQLQKQVSGDPQRKSTVDNLLAGAAFS